MFQLTQCAFRFSDPPVSRDILTFEESMRTFRSKSVEPNTNILGTRAPPSEGRLEYVNSRMNKFH